MVVERKTSEDDDIGEEEEEEGSQVNKADTGCRLPHALCLNNTWRSLVTSATHAALFRLAFGRLGGWRGCTEQNTQGSPGRR